MKPPEILSMLEEAAGTRMYETKKDAALKTLEKKQEQVRDNAVHGVDEIKAKITEIDNDTETMQTEIQEMETHVSKLTVEKDATMGGEVKALSDRVDAISTDLVKESSVLKNQKDNLATENKNAGKLKCLFCSIFFSYCDPVKNFDRSKVKGVVAKLVKV
nr:hypothetical protein [Tanacetum cinerariifolium]